MTTDTRLPRTPAAARPPLERPEDAARWGGVCAGLVGHLGAPAVVVRWVFAGLALVGGAGAVLYALLWLALPLRPAAAPAAGPPPGSPAGGEPGPPPGGPASTATAPAPPRWSPSPEQVLGLVLGSALLAGGATVLAQRAGSPVGVGPVVVGVTALAAAVGGWGLLAPAVRVRWRALLGASSRDGARRLVTGAPVAVAGLVAVAALGGVTTTLGPVLLGVAALLGGLALVLAPSALRLAATAREERAARLQQAQRAEVAAHLHDSVLQTLAVIQRRCADPVEVARLARAQERELRAWLYGGGEAAPAGASATVAGAVRAVAAAVEDEHAVPVELVVVGDRPLDRPADAVVHALREALVNAVRHGRPPVQVYVEVGPHALEAFVRDHGDGFDPAAVPADRWGVRESVIGRTARAGGLAAFRRPPDGGTEVHLRLPAPTAERVAP